MRNVYTAFFKTGLTSQVGGARDVASPAIFVARSVVPVGAVVFAIEISESNVRAATLAPITLIAYLSLVTRQVELRYLARVDALLLAFFLFGVASISNWYVLRKSGSRTA